MCCSLGAFSLANCNTVPIMSLKGPAYGHLMHTAPNFTWPHPLEKSKGSGQLPGPFSFSPPESGGSLYFL